MSSGPGMVVAAFQQLATWDITLGPAPGGTLPDLRTATSIVMHIYGPNQLDISGSPVTCTATGATTITCNPPALAVGTYTAEAIATWSDGGTSPSSQFTVEAIVGQPGAFVNPTSPSLPDFLTFLSNSVQIPSAALPAFSAWPSYALDQAIELTPCTPCGLGLLYTLAVYNCATHLLIMITPDQAALDYFQEKRSRSGFGLVQPSSGVIASASDEATSTTLSSPDWSKKILPMQLQFFKTPWGREWLEWCAAAGPNVVGLT